MNLPLIDDIEPALPSIIEQRLAVDENGCWLWLGALYQGYGKVHWRGRVWRVHRLVYEVLRGPVPAGLELDHLCRVRRCANPEHLEPVTGEVNNLRGNSPSAVCARAVVCPKGHPYGARRREGQRRCNLCRNERARLLRRERRDQAAVVVAASDVRHRQGEH